mgnify:CR=1 FL=1
MILTNRLYAILFTWLVAVTATSPLQAQSESDADTRVVMFYQVGCGDCERVEGWLEELQRAMPELAIERYNIKEPAAMCLNEALADNAGLDEYRRLVAPAVFTQAGALVRNNITFGELAALLDEAVAATNSNPEGASAWATLLDAQSQGSAVDERITERFSRMTASVVIAAGFLDGINPCAFATILFFLSYLHMARRGPGQMLQVGIAFALAIFLTYLALGFGIARALAEAQAMRGLAIAFNWLLVGVALILAVLSFRDGVLCLQGKLKDTALKLPMFLRKRINAAIRESARHRRFVVAAFITGVVVALLELACTGQVYLPTIMYVHQSGAQTLMASKYLVLYNVAFIVPLVVIIVLACYGLSNERLTGFFQKHVAWVKFATAGLFALMLVMLLFSMGVL